MKKFGLINTLGVVSALCLAQFGNANNQQKLNDKVESQNTPKVTFTENKGQIHDQNFKSRPDVLFGGTDGNLTFHLKMAGISYQLNRIDSGKKEENKNFRNKLNQKVPDMSTIYRLDVNWLNSNANANIIKGKATEGFSNYYLETCPDGALNVKSFEEVTYNNIYNGVDLKWYQKDGRLKYDYLVSAGADYKQIQFEFKGASAIKINNKGELVLTTPLGEIIEQAPIVIQQNKVLRSGWAIKNNIVTFEIKKLDKTKSFVIDPLVRAWGTYYGDTGPERGNFCTTDNSGNVYLVGNTQGTGTLLATSGAHQTVDGGGTGDIFLVKFNSSGVRSWGTYYGSSNIERGFSCAVDVSGNVFIVGEGGNSTGVISTSGCHQPNHSGGGLGYDCFLVKFNSSGVRQWGTFYGESTGDEYGRSCATDASGNVYMTGYSSSTGAATAVATSGAHQTTSGGGNDGFLVKFNSSGVRQWGTFYGGSGSDVINSCAISSGDIYVVGYTTTGSGTAIATTAGHQTVYGTGADDAFLVKFNSSGVRQWGTYYGGAASDQGNACAVDGSGNVFIAGHTTSATSTLIASSGSHQSALGAGNDAFFAKFNSAGVRQWGTYYGGTGTDYGYGCATDALGNSYLAGRASSGIGTIIATANSYQPANAGSDDAFIVKFDASGVRQYGSYYGGTGSDIGYATAVDASNNVYITGSTASTNTISIATSNGHQTFYASGTDAFLVKLFDCQAPANPTGSNMVICENNTVALTATSGTTTINWYATPSSTTVLGTGTAYITPTLSAGTYTYYAEALTCAPSASRTVISLTVNSQPTISVNSGTICSGKTFTMVPGGGTSYTFSSGSATVSPVALINYTVTGANSFGCTNTVVSSVTVNPNPTITVNSNVICSGNIFTINPSGAISYTFSNGSNTVVPSTNSNYTINGSNAFGCTHSVVSTVTVNATPTISINSGSVCSGKIFTLTPSGATTYTYSSGSNTVIPLINTSYTVIGASTQGCTNSAISNITVNITPTITVNNGAICAGSSFTLVPGGASTYTFEGGGAVKTPTANSSYTVIGTSTSGCVSQAFAISNVTVNSNPTITVNNGSICSGSIFTIIPSGANSYTFSSGSNTIAPIGNTNYTVTGSSTQGCTTSAIGSITVNATPTINVNNGTICSGNTFTIIPTGGMSYTFSNGTNTVIPLNSSNYTVTGSSASGCTNTAISTVSVNTTPTITVNNGAVCPGGSFTLNPSGAASYTYSSGTPVVTPSSTSIYTVTGTSPQGCTSAPVYATVVYTNNLVVSIISSNTICSGQSILLTANGASTYTWNTGVISSTIALTPTTNTSYSVIGSSGSCSNSAATNVTVHPLPIVTASTSSEIICLGQVATLTALGALNYTWSSGSNASTITISPSTTTNYSVSGVNTNGCINTANITQTVETCNNINKYDWNQQTKVKVYPIPAGKIIHVEICNSYSPNVQTNYEIQILNSLGQIIGEHKLTREDNLIKVEDFCAGIYYFKIIGDKQELVYKVIKE